MLLEHTVCSVKLNEDATAVLTFACSDLGQGSHTTLRQVAADGPKRHQLGIKLGGVVPDPLGLTWEDVWRNNVKVGVMTSCMWSPRMRCNIGYVLISTDVRPGDDVEVRRPDGATAGRLTELPFL